MNSLKDDRQYIFFMLYVPSKSISDWAGWLEHREYFFGSGEAEQESETEGWPGDLDDLVEELDPGLH